MIYQCLRKIGRICACNRALYNTILLILLVDRDVCLRHVQRILKNRDNIFTYFYPSAAQLQIMKSILNIKINRYFLFRIFLAHIEIDYLSIRWYSHSRREIKQREIKSKEIFILLLFILSFSVYIYCIKKKKLSNRRLSRNVRVCGQRISSINQRFSVTYEEGKQETDRYCMIARLHLRTRVAAVNALRRSWIFI